MLDPNSIRKATPEEAEQHRQRVERATAALPEFLARAERRARAIQEQSVSGQLRRAVSNSGLVYEELAARSGVDIYLLADFMTGDTPLSSADFDRLAAVLNYELTPVGSAPQG